MKMDTRLCLVSISDFLDDLGIDFIFRWVKGHDSRPQVANSLLLNAFIMGIFILALYLQSIWVLEGNIDVLSECQTC